MEQGCGACRVGIRPHDSWRNRGVERKPRPGLGPSQACFGLCWIRWHQEQLSGSAGQKQPYCFNPHPHLRPAATRPPSSLVPRPSSVTICISLLWTCPSAPRGWGGETSHCAHPPSQSRTAAWKVRGGTVGTWHHPVSTLGTADCGERYWLWGTALYSQGSLYRGPRTNARACKHSHIIFIA